MRTDRNTAAWFSAAQFCTALALYCPLPASAANEATQLKLTFKGEPPQVMFNARRDGCQPIDTPDVPPRAYRDDKGQLAMFTLHFVNRALRGPDLEHLKIDCNVSLDSAGAADPARYDDRRYVAATWTDDGKQVSALIHHEYHADQHGTCKVEKSIGCWFNTILAFGSRDGGRTFSMARPPVVASAPFRADVGEGRHRGFFNPSNIVADGRYKYMMAATTGWTDQRYGVCLFRSIDPGEAGSWRAFDGKDFTIRYTDPYGPKTYPPQPCAVIEPFLFPVGSIVRHRASGTWVAVWMAAANDKQFPVSGFYYASSADLMSWSAPRLLRAGRTLHDSTCDGGIMAYPALIDEAAKGRNFDDTGDDLWLYYMTTSMVKCQTGNRMLTREKLGITFEDSRSKGAAR